MGFGFEIDVVPTRAVRYLHGAAIAVGAGGFALAGWLAGPPLGVVLGALAPPAGWLAWRFGGRTLAWGRLGVDEGGRACWDAADDGHGGTRAVRIERWWATDSLVWIRFGLAGERRARDLVLARSGCETARWRSLRTWLAWLGRGGA